MKNMNMKERYWTMNLQVLPETEEMMIREMKAEMMMSQETMMTTAMTMMSRKRMKRNSPRRM